MPFILLGNSISPDSMTSTSGRLATSSGGRSSGRATSVMTQPGLTLVMSRIFLPAPEVDVTIMSMSPSSSSYWVEHTTWASGVSARIDAFNSSSFLMSRPATTTSSKAIASSRALTEPIEPVAPMTMVLAGMRPPVARTSTRPMRRMASAAAQSAPEAE